MARFPNHAYALGESAQTRRQYRLRRVYTGSVRHHPRPFLRTVRRNHCSTICLHSTLNVIEIGICTGVEESPLRNDLVHQRVQAGPDGMIAPPEGPGLGITINEEVVSSLLVAESGW